MRTDHIFKYGTTFVGPCTLFKDSRGVVVVPRNDQGARWIVGADDATSHSEPPFTSPRIFCSEMDLVI